jgi:hypothetical protein
LISSFISFISSYAKGLTAHRINTWWWTIFLAPYSHYIMPLDFVLWRCVKDYVYRNTMDDTATLHIMVIKAVQSAAKES